MSCDANSVEPELLHALGAAVGPEHICTSQAARLAWGRAAWSVELKRAQLGDWSALPLVVVRPSGPGEIAQLMPIARRFHVPLVPYGGGSGVVAGTCLGRAIVVDLKRLDHIVIHPIDQTVTAGAGVIGSHLEETLEAQGFTSGHFPQSMNSSTVGGWVATSSVGIFSNRYGKLEDLLVGLEVVLPSGGILRTKPIQRRSDGPNLSSIFLGSEGMLGIVTAATLKIWPRPEVRRWVAYTFPDTHCGLQALHQVMGSDAQPALARLYDEAESASRLARFAYPSGQSLLILAFEGPSELVRWQMQQVDKVCLDHLGLNRGEEAALDWYRRRFDTSGMLRADHRPGGVSDAIEVAATWQDLESVWRSMRAALEPLALQVHCHFSHLYHWGGSVYVIFHAEAQDGTPQGAMGLYDRCLAAAIEASLRAGGNLSHHHGIGRSKSRWLQDGHGQVGVNLLRALKRAIDPEGLLNPGVLGVDADEQV